MTSPALAKADRTTVELASAKGAALAGKQRVVLITGDRVVVDAKGAPVAIEKAKGRAHIPVRVQRAHGRTLVIPADAQRLVTSGKLDKRLFDVVELARSAKLRAPKAQGADQGAGQGAGQGQGELKTGELKVIVGYENGSGPAAAAKARVRAADDAEVTDTLTALNAEAVTVAPEGDATALWDALTSEERGSESRATASGVQQVWLDGVRKASLDKSTKQIGADKAWAAGYDGKGVKIAVLDTGVDQSHPDLRTQEIAEKNFTESKDTVDRVGHGTHVASIAAGTGAKSGGTYKGVAPGAKILDGKVLDDNGFGDDSGIIAGMEWAVAEGADIVNLSLGGWDTPEVDPLEEAVNTLSRKNGTLFAIAAGNDGMPGSVGSPGSADEALTVGAVDDKNKLADFSSQGPRIGDGAIKPDVTAPGVDTTAAAAPGSEIEREVGQKPDGYLSISGTSMATPHVAGAAALLKQQHPDWGKTELKGALTASTKPGKYTPFEQGSGRIAVDKALKQTVIAEPVSLSFGVQQWPHNNDKPVTKKITYRNLGDKPVTLDLAVTATGPKGKPAPKGFFTVGSKKLTVPAGGTAAAKLTADTRIGGKADGMYAAYVVATGGGQSVRTAAAVDREIESYNLTLRHTGRNGKPAEFHDTTLAGVSGLAADQWLNPYDASGTVKVRVPKGGYLLDSQIVRNPEDLGKGYDWLAQPQLNITKNTTVKLDARLAKPVKITMPAKGAKNEVLFGLVSREVRGGEYGFGVWLDEGTADNLRTAHLGPKVTEGSLSQFWSGQWTKGAATQYAVNYGGKVKRLATGYTKKVKTKDLARVKVGLGASAKGKKGAVSAEGWLPGQFSAGGVAIPQKAPGTRTFYLSTANKVTWNLDYAQLGGLDEDGFPESEAYYVLGAEQTFKAGKTYKKTANTAVFGPKLTADYGVFREGNELGAFLPVFADGKGNDGSSLYSSVRTTLLRDGKKVGQNGDPLTGETFKVPAGDALYKLSTSVKRDQKIARAASRIDVSFTFRSKKAKDAKLPVSTVRFTPKLALDSTAKAGKRMTIPVTVQGAATGKNLKALAVATSYDGKKWKRATVAKEMISVKNPAKGKSISLRATVVDKKGNKSTIAIYDAYFGK
ncbi:S8 family peptidase [Streptomyces apocyni]|uniref:S8 family peptidase n=1 Tax=Streptomyces apocyni TaxID=2654677 RepID=UPI0012EA537E|nr:S8 family serine peptidase [Streptomyces apocyni]